ncbi:DUF1905 domain-containing protein [Candidatus Gracilibacteria bacterium]|nr:DUF1905 domain-containing protein [Candidatus Gracilibacteria bacterium]
MENRLTFTASLWRYSALKGSWYFVTLPKGDAEFLRWIEDKTVVGFGFIRVQAHIGNSEWETTLFPSKEHGSYLLAVNAQVRKMEMIKEGDELSVTLSLQ